MMTLYYSPETRASRMINQLMLIGKLDQVKVEVVDIVRADGSGKHDAKNPHIEGKVPMLVTDTGEKIRESNAIMLYLDEQFDYPLGIAPGQPGRGAFLSWMTFYGGIVEPMLQATMLGIDNEKFLANFGGMAGVVHELSTALKDADYLVGDRLTIADIIMASPFHWMPSATPDVPAIKAWVERVQREASAPDFLAYEAAAKEKLGIA